jgi:hypothetical protein
MQMSVLYSQFCITDVIPDLKTKAIVVVTNFKVDASTVNYNTVSLYDYKDTGSQIAEYDLHVDGKNICIMLKDYPAPNTRFYLKINDIYDALNRKINYAYNDYIVFNNDVVTDVAIVSPGFRETFSENIINIELKITDPLEDGLYRIQISPDNVFFKIMSTITYNATSDELINDSDAITVIEHSKAEGRIKLKTDIDYNGQLYIRARAEREEGVVGRWSETSSFTLYTVPLDSMDTTFLDSSLTTFDLFPDEFEMAALEVNSKSTIADITDRAFYLEFNKEIKLPENYETDADGYVLLGTITGFRKGLK